MDESSCFNHFTLDDTLDDSPPDYIRNMAQEVRLAGGLERLSFLTGHEIPEKKRIACEMLFAAEQMLREEKEFDDQARFLI